MNFYLYYKVDKILLVFIFFLAIYVPLFFGGIQVDQLVSKVEKRTLAIRPNIPSSIDAIKQYPDAFNMYYSDHFGLRETLTQAYFTLVSQLKIKNSIGEMTFGKDGWLFLGSITSDGYAYNDQIGDAINKNIFSANELEKFAKSSQAIKKWLGKQGVEYLFVIAPNKHSIYFDKMPDYIVKQGKLSATDQLVSYLRMNTDVTVVDLRPALLEERKKHQVYFKTDTHWNYYGANAAQFEIMKQVGNKFPKQVKPYFLENKQFTYSSKDGGDLANLAKIQVDEDVFKPVFDGFCDAEVVSEVVNKIAVTTTVCESERLRSVIFGDSFFSTLQPFISKYFYKATYIKAKMSHELLKKYIALESPDVIIEELVERNFPYVPVNKLVEQ